MSTTSARAALGPEAWLWASVTRACSKYGPSARAAGLQLQDPDASALLSQTAVSPRYTETRDPDWAWPVRSGEASRVGDDGASNTGVFSVRTLRGTAAEGPLRFSTWVTWNAVNR